jgi:hypothetical protein
MKKYRLLTQGGWHTYNVNQVYNIVDDPDLLRHVKNYPNDWELVDEGGALPEKWYCVATEDNIKMLDEWRKSVASYWTDHKLYTSICIVSKHKYDDSYVFCGDIEDNSFYSEYQEITTEQFRKLVHEPHFKNKNTMKTIISFTEIMKIHSVACNTWKQKIATEYLPRVNSDQKIQFTIKEIEDMFEVATTSQKSVLEEIFGKQQEKIDWDKIKTGSKVMIKHTGEHCDGFSRINESKPVTVVFFKTKHFICHGHEFVTSGSCESCCTFYQDGNYVLFSSVNNTDYITSVVEY